MLFKTLKRKSVQDMDGVELVEPSAGIAAVFIAKMNEFPKATSADGKEYVVGHYFAGLRVLICMYYNGKPYITELTNSLNNDNPVQWPLTVSATNSVRDTLDALDKEYLIRLVDYFIDNISMSELESINEVIRKDIWIDKEASKNE